MICANVLGSCYGTPGPTDFTFPRISVRDMVSAHQLLKNHLNLGLLIQINIFIANENKMCTFKT